MTNRTEESRVVPREPTQEMAKRGAAAWANIHNVWDVWRAMWDAAPPINAASTPSAAPAPGPEPWQHEWSDPVTGGTWHAGRLPAGEAATLSPSERDDTGSNGPAVTPSKAAPNKRGAAPAASASVLTEDIAATLQVLDAHSGYPPFANSTSARIIRDLGRDLAEARATIKSQNRKISTRAGAMRDRAEAAEAELARARKLASRAYSSISDWCRQHDFMPDDDAKLLRELSAFLASGDKAKGAEG